jgi:hypothetical protein
MKLPKLLLGLVLLLGLGAVNAGAATMGSLYVSGNGYGHAIVIGGDTEVHQVWADQYQNYQVYSPDYGTKALEQDMECGGTNSSYYSECTLTVAEGETFSFSFSVYSSGSGFASIYVNSTMYYGNESGNFVLGPGTYRMGCHTSMGSEWGNAYANICGSMN